MKTIRTLRGSDGAEASFCPERGGIITSLKLAGKEMLYFDEETFLDETLSVKGGIPILFPNAGPLPDDIIIPPELQGLKQHGFARQSNHWTSAVSREGFIQTLLADSGTEVFYPFDFELSIHGKFETGKSFTLSQTVLNRELSQAMPISMGLHPYFKVPFASKRNIEFDFPGGDVLRESFDKWSNGKAVSIPNPMVENRSAVMKVVIPGLGTLLLKPSAEYRRIWVWSQPGKDFVCIEPVMGDKGRIITDPAMVGPQSSYSALFTIELL